MLISQPMCKQNSNCTLTTNAKWLKLLLKTSHQNHYLISQIFTLFLKPMKIQIINGPNLNLLGKREPGIYGSEGFETFFDALKTKYATIELHYFQSNVEGEIINKLHQIGFSFDGVVINAGAYTHTSIAIADAIAAIKSHVIEVHISNVYAREDYRHHSMMAKNCKGIITGFGLQSYELGVISFL